MGFPNSPHLPGAVDTITGLSILLETAQPRRVCWGYRSAQTDDFPFRINFSAAYRAFIIGTMNEAEKFAALVRKAQTGDTRAFDLLVKQFQDAAVGYGAALMGDFQAGQDTAQEAFLEMYRVLPALRVPAAFPAYLRLTVRKHCDRATRRKPIATVSLDAAFHVSGGENPAQIVETREEQSRVRNAVRELPENERVVIWLFYFGELSLREAADFLDVPLSTIKNRLFKARKHLKERITQMDEISEMVQVSLGAARPSESNHFRGAVISRLMGEYYAQAHGAIAPDRTLIKQAHSELNAALNENALDTQTVIAGANLLMGTQNFAGLPPLMERYLAAQKRDLSETFWAHWTRVRGLAMGSDAPATVQAQSELMAWMGDEASLSGIRLSTHEPFAPVSDAGAGDADVLSLDTLPVFALGIMEVGMQFHEADVFDEWLQMVNAAVTHASKTNANRIWRFYALRHAAHLLALYSRFVEADAFLSQIRALAGEEKNGQASRWILEYLILKLRRHNGEENRTEARQIAAEAIRELAAYRARPDMQDGERVALLQTLTHNLAAPLTASGDFDLALPLWEQIKLTNAWTVLWQAECVWAVRRDRSQAIDLLKKAAAYRFDDALLQWFDTAKGFAAVQNDAEFRAALSHENQSGGKDAVL